MKKFWKNLCACSLALACGATISACGKEENKSSGDLDGDGAISSWETMFDSAAEENLNIAGEIVYISSAQQLKDINKQKSDSRKIFVLQSDIDLAGEAVSIDLGPHEFYGNNHVIKNFQLSDISDEYKNSLSNEDIAGNTYASPKIKCLFYNGTGVHSTRVFLGVQSLNLKEEANGVYYSISTFFNVPTIVNCEVKGMLKFNNYAIANFINKKLDASLLYSGFPTTTQVKIDNEDLSDRYESVSNANDVIIESCSVDGKVEIKDNDQGLLSTDFGGIASRVTKDSMIYNCYAQLDISADSSSPISNASINFAGIVGTNNGFVTSCQSTGNINIIYNKIPSTSEERVGGIVGTNNPLAEIKNCSTNAKISFVNPKGDDVAEYNMCMGGIAGYNNAGILEMCQSDAEITLSNVKSAQVGGICGHSNSGIISYAICRGSINITNVPIINIAQVSGSAYKGLFEKIITTTSLNIKNTDIFSAMSDVNYGMITTFDNSNDNDNCLQESPYFRKILVDGVSEVYTKSEDNTKFDFKHGIRCEYDVGGNVDEVTGNYEANIILPEIFENIYFTSSFKLNKYTIIVDEKTGNKIPTPDNIVMKYADGNICQKQINSYLLTDELDFKHNLNHTQINLGGDTVDLKNLYFSIENELQKKTSYFGESKYNYGLAYFDRIFTEPYYHIESPFGSCEYDTKDEMMSFLFDLMLSNNGKSKEFYAIKVNKSYLDGAVLTDTLPNSTVMSSDAFKFHSLLFNAFTCLNVLPAVTYYNSENVQLVPDSNGVVEGDTVKYILYTFSDAKSKFILKLDISSLQQEINFANDKVDEYIMYLTFEVTFKIN